MKEKLLKLLDNAYCPYSNFRVSAIVVMKDGTEVPGVNVENASYGATICAERNAITTAVAMGYKRCDFDKLYLMTSGKKISSCCFICRQVITEFFDKTSLVTLMDMFGNEKVLTVEELCPYPFDEEDL